MRCGLLGEHLTHSYSPQIHALLGEYSYELFEVAPERLGEFLRSGCFDGLNVTIPYKEVLYRIRKCRENQPMFWFASCYRYTLQCAM